MRKLLESRAVLFENFLSTVIFTLSLAVATAVQAQSNAAGIAFGTTAAAAKVVLENIDTAQTRTIRAGESGRFRVDNLPPGRYHAESAGNTAEFKVQVGTAVEVKFAQTLDQIEVRAKTSVNPIDFLSTESNFVLSEAQIDRLPVARDLSSVALLAPGTTAGDAEFGNLAAFSGASVAENAYYFNGFNISNFRNGLGFSEIPFEFISESQVKTGGYSVEFGRSTGGVINAVSKRGSNEWQFSLSAIHTPDQLRASSRDIYDTDGASIYLNQANYSQSSELNLSVAGPLWQDRLFVYALTTLRDARGEGISGNGLAFNIGKGKDPFYGLKLDAVIADGHSIEFTGYSNQGTGTSLAYDFDLASNARAGAPRLVFGDSGGTTQSLRYNGQFTDELTVSALIGRGEFSGTSRSSGDNCPALIDFRSGARRDLGCWINFTPARSSDLREAARIDFTYAASAEHYLRFGVDREDNQSTQVTGFSGDLYWSYRRLSRDGVLNGVSLPAGTEYARLRILKQGGEFSTLSSAVYIEDQWQASNDWFFTVGLRNEAFDNKNLKGQSFIRIENQIAPRFGFSWDAKGDRSIKIFGNAGRYFLPVASNTNLRLASGELFYEEYYQLRSVQENGLPIVGAAIGTRATLSDGAVPETRSIVDQNLKPMYQDELIFGFQRELDHWSFGARAVYRDLGRALEDVIINDALIEYASTNSIDYNPPLSEGLHYILTNPGQDARISWDFGNGLQPITLTRAQLGLPRSTRKYHAVEFFFERPQASDDIFGFSGSYTWSKSYGNNEGYVRSDNAQTDAGLTNLFDLPEIVRAAYGNLPNDRRHQIKLLGNFALSDDIELSASFQLRQGRPRSCFGRYPVQRLGRFENSPNGYGPYLDDGFYCDGQLVPRGSLGRTPWVRNLDVGIRWQPKAWLKNFTARFDLFNLANEHTVLEQFEQREILDGTVLPSYGVPSHLQSPRSARVSVDWHW